jgi:RNA polymerase sigma-70 factor (ECF subfamily)
MVETNGILELIEKAKAGDQNAASELVGRYEPAVRRAVRMRLFDSRLRRAFDSMDICQSVMGSFFLRLRNGQFPMEQPEQVLKLLVSMAHNKLTDQVRRQRAKRRGGGRIEEADVDARDFAGTDPTPSRQVALKELIAVVRDRLSPDEARLLELRDAGVDWAEIAAEMGGSPEALRKRFARARERVQEEIGSVSV